MHMKSMRNIRSWLVCALMGVALFCSPARMYADGWTPTDGGLVVDLKQGDQILISVMVGDREYFVGNYSRYAGDDYFHYKQKKGNDSVFIYADGKHLKLLQQAANAKVPSEMTVWQVDTALTRIDGNNNYSLGGVAYTIWNDDKTLKTQKDTRFKFYGDLTDDIRNKDACDVVFVVPTRNPRTISFDPEKTLTDAYGRTDQETNLADKRYNGRFNSVTGIGFAGMVYREVYMLEIPRSNDPRTYTNAALVTFNTTNSDKKWHAGTIKPGMAAYAYADNTTQKPHHRTTRTVFRLYVLNRPFVKYSSYIFATDEQNYRKYRQSNVMTDSTSGRKTYSVDWMYPMYRESTSSIYKTKEMNVPVSDSTYFYIGKDNTYVNSAEEDTTKQLNPAANTTAVSQFKNIRTLKIDALKDKTYTEDEVTKSFFAPKNAYGKMKVDTTSTDTNLAVTFEPAGYMLRTSTGLNVRMKQIDPTTWMSEEMWTISEYYNSLSIKATLWTGPEFSESDPGADIEGWSVMQQGTILKDQDGNPVLGKSGWARIMTNEADTNGNIVLWIADTTRWIHYDNNGFLGTQIPDQYPVEGKPTVAVEANRLKIGYTFDGWTTNQDGIGTTYQAGDTYNFGESTGQVTLYAQAHYDGTYDVMLSFMQGDKRYYLNHPGSAAPRYSRARHYDDWANTWQGMANAENNDPNYVSTFRIMTPRAGSIKAGGPLIDGEHALDPKRDTVHGYVDSLILYEYFSPARDEYLGLYYTDPNTIIANNTWAGLFIAEVGADGTKKWPDYRQPIVNNAKLKSTHYLTGYTGEGAEPGDLQRVERTNSGVPYVKYNASADQFDGVNDSAQATKFQISSVVVADAHYVILPDTSEIWRDTITFGWHEEEQTREEVWSKLIGKQLMAASVAGSDTIYFHPNRDKIFNTPQELYLSEDFRLTQSFDFIQDARVTSVAAADRVTREETDDYWRNNFVSGVNSPMDVKDKNDRYIDIIDTFRVSLRQGGISQIKEYRGRWNAKDSHVKASKDGTSRYRDVIIRTKTYHYGAELTRYVLKPEKEVYSFGPLVGEKQQLNFILTQEHYHNLLDAQNAFVREDITKIDTVTNKLQMLPGSCVFRVNHAFEVVDAETNGSHATLNIIDENTDGTNYDTLVVTRIHIDGTPLSVDVRVPLVQAALTAGNELIWSVMKNGQRYFIMAGKGESNHFIFRQYTRRNDVLYKRNTSTTLIKGSKDAANSDERYITPWIFTYTNKAANQLTLKMGLTATAEDTLYVNVNEDVPTAAASGVALTFEPIKNYTNDNANYEEKVRIKYGSNQWLKFTDGVSPTLTLTKEEAQADTFSWSYMQQEYNLLNNGTYPSQDMATFGYNTNVSVTINTKVKAYREYTMLLDSTYTSLCREESTHKSYLIGGSGDNIWKLTCTIDTVRDRRTSTLSGFIFSTNDDMVSTIRPATATSPTEVKDAGGKYIDIVDTLCVTLGMQGGEGVPSYRFKGDWSGYKHISEANLKIPLVRLTYHEDPYDSLSCMVAKDQESFTFPATIVPGTNDTVKYLFSTIRKTGSQVLDVQNNVVAVTSTSTSYVTTMEEDENNKGMHLNQIALAEIRLMDEYGNTPTWCEIKAKGDTTIVVRCKQNGVRSPRTAYLYMAYILTIDGKMRFVNHRVTVSQASFFSSSALQTLEHSNGASGDAKMANGMQQVHENKRILYYYPDEEIELPVRERGFYGWWRWYREGRDEKDSVVSDYDVPDSLWIVPPHNAGRYSFPFKTILVDSVWVDEKNPSKGKKRGRTMGRYTVFHYKSRDYNNKNNPPAKNPRVAPPINKETLTYVVDLSNYYDNLPMSVSQKNQVDTAMMDTMPTITEPTLSLREIFELHPWTEMAAKLEGYKSANSETYTLADEHYMEDHTMMAPTGHRLLLRTEQRYNYSNLQKRGLSESLLGYYIRDDHWSDLGWDAARQDTMIWCIGWDADCKWFTYDTTTHKYTECKYSVTEGDDFLQVPVKNNVDTVYYCLRARSKSTTGSAAEGNEKTEAGNNWYNICRYKIIYHDYKRYGPMLETTSGGETKALINNDEIEQRYEVLERLNFDYNQPGNSYTVYSHPLPWADASYGFTYPETSNLPHNRYHNESDFPNYGEYGLINRIPYSTYWHQMEQHGGAANGYMIYCDGMSSSGQVAALSLETNLCAGQKMFFSGYVGNPSNQTGKAEPNFIFTVQGSTDGENWDDITNYMTGDIAPSDQWYQIFFPINHNKESKDGKDVYTHFRVRIYNVSSNFDGNDFIIDDMCIFATKPPLIAYQANTSCKEEGENKDTHVILRVDYQGITGEGYNDKKVYYTVQEMTPDSVFSFVSMSDGYMEEDKTHEGAESKPDTIFGKLFIPALTYEPQDEDSIFANVNELLDKFEDTYKEKLEHPDDPAYKIFREGYIYEILEGEPRPVKYMVHSAQMDPKNTYTVHMSGTYGELMSSICGMTSYLKVSNRMVLELNGLEEPVTEVIGLCANSTYDVSLRVKGSLYLDSVAPIDLNGSCVNDWLLYGDTLEESSKKRYGYYYSDIKKVITQILRVEPSYGTNKNQFAPNLSSINKNELKHFTGDMTFKQAGLDPYTMISDLVKNGFLILYKSQMTVTVNSGDSVQYIILPIVGTGTDALNKANIEVCPAPIFVKLQANRSGGIPLMIGGLHRDTTENSKPIEVLMSEKAANEEFKLIVDSIMPLVGIKNITLRSTNDPNFREGVHSLRLLPDISYPTAGTYYTKGDSIDFSPAPGSYHMQPGYSYTFNVVMQTFGGLDTLVGGCAVGTIPFILSVMPDYLRWDPQSAQSNEWNNADNWIGVTKENVPIHEDAHYAPMAETYVVIPQVEAGLPYPVVPPLPTVWKDSVQKVNFEYNNCNVIRFLPGAAMGQQQRMRYSDAVIDMEMPQQKWAFRAAPVTGMLSGDIYMSNADLNWASNPWKVAEFDASGRSYKTGNGSFWLSVYSRNTIHQTEDETEARSAKADWSKVTNGLNLSLPAGQGYAVYARTKSGKDAVVRLPKHDDIYYYYGSYGETLYDHYVNELETARSTNAAPRTAGKLAFHEDSEGYTMSNDNSVSTTGFVFGNPTMGYIDIWGFIDDNCLVEEFGYLDESGAASIYRTVSREAAMASTDTIIEQKRYLPPMRSIMVQKSSAATSLPVTLNSNRVVTDPSQVVPSVRCGGGGDQSLAQTPQRGDAAVLRKGIMTVTAINPCSPRCTSYLLLGQGYHADILSGEDALLTTLNIDNFSTTGTPTTPFNIYAKEDSCGLSIDLRDEIVNVPISFYMSKMTYDNVTHLWFTGVNAIDGPLVLYDAQTDTERAIIDGICLDIATPKTNHETRYYIRRRGWTPDSGWGSGVTTDIRPVSAETNQTMKIIHEGHVLIIRNGQVFTMMGQQVR